MKRIALAILVALAAGAAIAETASVIDPTESIESRKPQGMAAKPSAQDEAAHKRTDAEQRKRARAQARAREAERKAADRESARLRALEHARQEAAAREAARKTAAAQAAATQAAAARAAIARAAASKAAAARLAAMREAAARELAERESAARDKAMKEEAAKQAAAKETADRLQAAREATVRENQLKRVAARERDAPNLKELPPMGAAFRDCARCPELVWLPQGEFAMGDAAGNAGSRQVVAIRYKLAVGRFEVTFAEWDACVAAGGCRRRPYDAGWGRGRQPVINVSWADAQEYVAWLSQATGKRYRLLTEAEWEYAARAGTDVRYWWGDQASRGDANCAECGSKWDGRQAAPVGRFAPNPFGLHDMHGNVSEWVEDCYRDRCSAPSDSRTVRGGAWYGSARSTRSTSRTSAASDYADNGIGFRVARTD